MLKLVLIGPPGAGKGTQAKKISAKYQIPHISTGDILRESVANESKAAQKVKPYIESGQLAPDELILELLYDRLHRKDCGQGYILDGFPRNLGQAMAFHKLLSSRGEEPPFAICIEAEKQTILERLTGRRSCEKCGAVYNIAQAPPKESGICDRCGGTLYQRQDDREDIIGKRLEVYFEQTLPLVKYYESMYRCYKIDGSEEIQHIFDNICRAIEEAVTGIRQFAD